MRRKTWIPIYVILTAALVFAGCGGAATTQNAEDAGTSQSASSDASGQAAESTTAGTKTDGAKTDSAAGDNSAAAKGQSAAAATDTTTAAPVTVTLTYSNEDATAFTTESVTIPELTPQALLDALAAREAIPSGVKALDFNKTTDSTGLKLELNLSSEFQTALNNSGTTGEYMTLGAVINTFLDAYQASGIKLLNEGQPMESSHAGELSGYRGRYK